MPIDQNTIKILETISTILDTVKHIVPGTYDDLASELLKVIIKYLRENYK